MTNRLNELTTAYLAIEGLLESPLISEVTKKLLKKTFESLNAKSAVEIKKYAGQDRLHELGLAS